MQGDGGCVCVGEGLCGCEGGGVLCVCVGGRGCVCVGGRGERSHPRGVWFPPPGLGGAPAPRRGGRSVTNQAVVGC